MPEVYINDYTNTLTAPCSNAVTTISVAAAASAASGFRILIGTELLQVTGGGTTLTWTVVRGIESSLAVAHLVADPVHVVLTAGGLNLISSIINLTGTLASLPAAGIAGRTFIPTDSLFTILIDNGATWDYYYQGRKLGVMPATTSVNLAGPNVTSTAYGPGATLSTPGTGQSAFNTGGLVKAKIAATFSFTVGLVVNPDGGGSLICGLVLSLDTNAAHAKRTLGTIPYAGGGLGQALAGTDFAGSWSAVSGGGATLGGALQSNGAIYFRVVEDVTNRTYFYSQDNGITFRKLFQEAVGTGFTTGFYGVFVTCGNGSKPADVTFIDWVEV